MKEAGATDGVAAELEIAPPTDQTDPLDLPGDMPVDVPSDTTMDIAVDTPPEVADVPDVAPDTPDVQPDALPDTPDAGCECPDDGLDCTIDECIDGECTHTIKSLSCVLEEQCVVHDFKQPGKPCMACQTNLSQIEWTPVPDGTECLLDGICLSGTCCDPECDDGDQCSADSCDEDTGDCINDVAEMDGKPCEDGNPCSDSEICFDGDCWGQVLDELPLGTDLADCICREDGDCAPLDADGNACTGVPVCDKAAPEDELGECAEGPQVDCEDDNVCTADSCEPASGTCSHEPVEQPCDDGSLCTDGDACVEGECNPGDLVICDDDNECTTDSCDPATGCVFEGGDGFIGQNCDDDNPCTLNDQCNAQGECTYDIEDDCDDGNDCTADTCDPSSGCVNEAYVEETGCEDGDFCTLEDYFEGVECKPGAPLYCNDDEACTVHLCAPCGEFTNPPLAGD